MKRRYPRSLTPFSLSTPRFAQNDAKPTDKSSNRSGTSTAKLKAHLTQLTLRSEQRLTHRIAGLIDTIQVRPKKNSNLGDMEQVTLVHQASAGDTNKQVCSELPSEVVQCLENARFVCHRPA